MSCDVDEVTEMFGERAELCISIQNEIVTYVVTDSGRLTIVYLSSVHIHSLLLTIQAFEPKAFVL